MNVMKFSDSNCLLLELLRSCVSFQGAQSLPSFRIESGQ
jgi:hypothetical protein